MDHICTWFCADKKGEESKYAQTGEISSSQEHWQIYLRCLAVFFTTSKFFNKTEKHILFTNVKELPLMGDFDLGQLLNELGVQVVQVDFNPIPPQTYHSAWRNQFYVFSILGHIADHYDGDNHFLVLDADCVFVKPSRGAFDDAKANDGFLSYLIDYNADDDINGLSRLKMREIYRDLLERPNIPLPEYHAGEFFLGSVHNIKKIHADFVALWPKLLERNENGHPKFTEEAHTLSYIFYKNGFQGGGANRFIRRIWTNPVFFRNIDGNEAMLSIWHLPAEKRLGFKNLFYLFAKYNFKLVRPSDEFLALLNENLGVSDLSQKQLIHYYLLTYLDAFKKKFRKKVYNAKRR